MSTNLIIFLYRYVIGKEAMYRLMNARVIILGSSGLGIEIAKNIILSGVQSVHIQDHQNVTYADLSSQVYIGNIHLINRGKKTDFFDIISTIPPKPILVKIVPKSPIQN